MPTIAIEAKNLYKKFENFTAVDHISFAIQEGECFGFLGPNGAGKTSTMKMIYCFSPISGGSLQVLGKNVCYQAKEIKREMGVVPQEDSLDPDLTVIDNLLVYANYFDIPKIEASKRADELLSFLQLEEKRNEKINNLSGGMKRRLVIARSLLNRPKILILDEPTTGLDPQARHLIWNKLRSLKKSGVTMVLTTHYMEEATQLCDRLVIMNEAKILAQGSPLELIRELVGKEVYEIRAPSQALIKLSQLISEKGFRVELQEEVLYVFIKEENPLTEELLSFVKQLDFHHRMATLEDVFLKVAGRDLKVAS
ncbi:MAG: ATP-binding cassette domain-containing protein [Deltaproteobacteria bacterium]|nr:ATP-binding cassette domain-containing protein [Deltaproteobacteria bacterium]